jgi:dephospho-CoA kinase
MKKRKVVIGVGGNIGSGKTTVAKIFKSFGMKYISADRIGWQVLPVIAEELKKEFGDGIFAGSKIDRKKLRAIVFSNKRFLQKLNRLSHPLILRKIKERLDRIHSGMVIVDAALLFDWKDLLKDVDYPILVKAPLEVKKKRAEQRGIDNKTFQQIIKNQKRESEMEKLACCVINNTGTLAELKRQCQKVFKELKNGC